MKIIGTMILVTAFFLTRSIWSYAVAIGFLAIVVWMSNVPIKFMMKGLKGILAIILFTAGLNIFFTPGEDVIFQFYFLTITQSGAFNALSVIIRITMLIIGSSILTLTTSTIQLTDGIEFLLKPFKKIGVPSHEIAMMMTIALRFIPTLMEEMEKIMKAQAARGADFDTGGLIKKAKSLIPLLVPLFISAIRRAYDLATAMEARCYRGDYNRTRMKQLVITPLDIWALSVLAALVPCVILVNVFL